MAIVGSITSGGSLYFGPATYYLTDGYSTVLARTLVNVLWREGDWYYIETVIPKRRNYIQVDRVAILRGGMPRDYTVTLSSGYINAAATSKMGPAASYLDGNYLPRGETVHCVNEIIDGEYALVEYTTVSGHKKRVWFKHKKIAKAYYGPSAYRYLTGTYEGLPLHVIRIPVTDVSLAIFNKYSSPSAPYDGIYAGYDMPDTIKTLNIAIQNGSEVCVGAEENVVGKGAIYWTGSSLCWSQAADESQISGITELGTWAQGGKSMFLGNGNWGTLVANECSMGDIDTDYSYGRTAMVANKSTQEVYLFVAKTAKVTMRSFRKAIQAFCGIVDGTADSGRFKGIFLDHAGFQQFKAIDMEGTEITIN